MPAIDPKPPKQHWDNRPRPARRATKPAPLLDDAQARLLIADEKTFREMLFRDFVKFCRDAGAWVVSPPFDRQCRVLVPDGSPLLERLTQLPKYPVVKLPNVSHRLQGGRFVPVSEIEVHLWRG
jgi:hypothetical protein